MATMKLHLEKTIPEKMFRWENGAKKIFWGKMGQLREKGVRCVRNGAIAWLSRWMRDSWQVWISQPFPHSVAHTHSSTSCTKICKVKDSYIHAIKLFKLVVIFSLYMKGKLLTTNHSLTQGETIKIESTYERCKNCKHPFLCLWVSLRQPLTPYQLFFCPSGPLH